MAERWGLILYRFGYVAAVIGLISGGAVVARPGPDAALWLWVLIAAGLSTWLFGRIALYVLARR